MGTTFNKATIGVPRKIIKLASSHLCESLISIFNQSLQQGVVPDILILPTFTLSQLHQHSLKYLTNLYISSLSTIARSKNFFFNFNLVLEKDIQLPKL